MLEDYTKNHHTCASFCVQVQGWWLICASLPLAPEVIVHMHCITQLSYLKHVASLKACPDINR